MNTQKALYNSLRINWLKEQSLDVDLWKVQEYRVLSPEVLFESLASLGVLIDRNTFFLYANECDSPEDLVDYFTDTEDPEIYDRIYLIVFELWRKLLPEKQTLSIICDELDHQIFAYDHGLLESLEPLEDAISNLLEILQENTDYEEIQPEDAFNCLKEYCAHDIADFLYDYIAEQIDDEQISFATELLETFYEFMPDKKWFDFLFARITAETNFTQANEELQILLEEYPENDDPSLYLDILAFMVQGGDPKLFAKIGLLALNLIETEDDFIELLSISSDFYHCLDNELVEQKITALIENRKSRQLEDTLKASDLDVTYIQALFSEYENSLYQDV